MKGAIDFSYLSKVKKVRSGKCTFTESLLRATQLPKDFMYRMVHPMLTVQ